ncbi:MAG TPA: ribonuclease E inhibitor RraB [Verrucomicrobiae bacterium]|nr:ribonuclease E inhibitor RraB [Verrucomicrobiae bacterium]
MCTKPAPKLGDIVEIRTKSGLRYAQFSHYHSIKPNNWGALLRILPGVFTTRPGDFNELASSKELFFTFFPLQAAIKRGVMEVVANESIPALAQKFPLFRSGIRNPATGKVEVWWLWDGEKAWKVGQLTDAQLDLPIKQIPSYLMLVERIENGWTPRRAEDFIDQARASSKATENGPQASRGPAQARHFLIFNDRTNAENAAKKIRDLNLEVCVSELGQNWGVSVLQQDLSYDAVTSLTERLRTIATSASGFYDGTEIGMGGN